MRTTTLSSHVTWYKIGSYTPSKKYSKDKHLGPKYPKVFKEKNKTWENPCMETYF